MSIKVLEHELVKRASEFAMRAHQGQLRKNGKEYFSHAEGVARIVAEWSNDPEVVSAAYLHDVVENCCVVESDLAGEFGPRIARYVICLSKKSVPGPKIKLVSYCATLRKTSPAVKIIKAADIVHNASDDPKKGWFQQAELMMAVVESGKLGQYEKAIMALARSFRKLAAEVLQLPKFPAP